MKQRSRLPQASFVSVKWRASLHFLWRKANAKKMKALWSCCVGYFTLISLFDIRFSFHISTDVAQQFLYKLHTSLFLSLYPGIEAEGIWDNLKPLPLSSCWRAKAFITWRYFFLRTPWVLNVSFSISSNTWKPELLSRWNLFWIIHLYQSDHHRLWRESKLILTSIKDSASDDNYIFK